MKIFSLKFSLKVPEFVSDFSSGSGDGDRSRFVVLLSHNHGRKWLLLDGASCSGEDLSPSLSEVPEEGDVCAKKCDVGKL